MLLYMFALVGDTVARYEMPEPPRSNFYADAPARGYSSGRPGPGEVPATHRMRRAAEALDPCTECRCIMRPDA